MKVDVWYIFGVGVGEEDFVVVWLGFDFDGWEVKYVWWVGYNVISGWLKVFECEEFVDEKYVMFVVSWWNVFFKDCVESGFFYVWFLLVLLECDIRVFGCFKLVSRVGWVGGWSGEIVGCVVDDGNFVVVL